VEFSNFSGHIFKNNTKTWRKIPNIKIYNQYQGQLSLSSLWALDCLAEVEADLCHPIWQVRLHSIEMGFPCIASLVQFFRYKQGFRKMLR